MSEKIEKWKKKEKKLKNSFHYAIEGLASAFETEQNLKIHFLVMFLVIIAGFIFKITIGEWMICILLFGFVITLELINTAIETTVDLAMPEKHEKAKLAKDISAAAVLVTAITSILIGLLIFIPKF